MADTVGSGGTLDISQILAAGEKLNQGINDSVANLFTVMAGARQAGQQEQEGITAEAEAKNAALRATTALELKKNAAEKSAAAIFGTNPDASNFVVAAMSQNILDMKGDLDKQYAGIKGKMNTKFTDDPISWITNQFTLPTDVAAYNMQEGKLKQENEVLGMLQARTKEQVAIVDSISANTSLERVAAIEQQNLAVAAQNAAASKLKLATLGFQEINVRRALNKDTFDTMLQTNSALVQLQQLQLSRAHLNVAEKSLELNRQLKELQLLERTDRLAAERAWQAKLNNATAVTGMKPITVGEFKLMTGPRKELMEKLMTDPNIEEGRMGFNTAESLSVANGLNLPLTPSINLVRKKLIETVAPVIGDIMYATMKPGQQNAAQQTAIEAAVKKEYANIPAEGGIYSPAPLSKVLDLPAVAALPIAKNLEALTAAGPLYKTDANDILSVARTMMAKGATPDQIAGQIATMYRALTLDNNYQRQYNRFAVPLAEKHFTNVSTGAGWGATKVVDMTNTTQLLNVLTRMANADRAADLMAAAAAGEGEQVPSLPNFYGGTSSFNPLRTTKEKQPAEPVPQLPGTKEKKGRIGFDVTGGTSSFNPLKVSRGE